MLALAEDRRDIARDTEGQSLREIACGVGGVLLLAGYGRRA
ncbi:hypothetical protein ACQP1G_20300 [Nocardia sp. CA-107356]